MCQGNIGHKMWGTVPMIVEGMYPGTRPIGRKDGNIVGIEVLEASKQIENPRSLEYAVAG